jgi:hypothetical protein
MVAPVAVFRDVVDYDMLTTLTDFVTNGRFYFQLATRLETEVNGIQHAAGDPTVFGHASDGCKSHAGDATYYFQDRGDRSDAIYAFHVGAKIGSGVLWQQLKEYAIRRPGDPKDWMRSFAARSVAFRNPAAVIGGIEKMGEFESVG